MNAVVEIILASAPDDIPLKLPNLIIDQKTIQRVDSIKFLGVSCLMKT